MFWIGFTFGVVATVGFLITEHLMRQLNSTQRFAFFKSLFGSAKKRPLN